MVTRIDRSFDDNFAESWYKLGGDFSYMFSKKLIAYLKRNGKNPKSVLDIYCGAANFLCEMQKEGMECYGTEGSKAFIRFNEQRYSDMKFYHTENMADFGTKQKFDLITCIYDLVNYLEIFSDWEELFKAAYKALNKDGVFTFDINTEKKLADWNEVSYEQSPDMDYVESVKSGVHGKTAITYVYYVKDGSRYVKTSDVRTETAYPLDMVVKALQKVGFRDVKICNFNLDEVENPEQRNKVHFVAIK